LGGLFVEISGPGLLGAIYYLIAAFALYKKPIIGYILVSIAALGLLCSLFIFRYVNQY